jgi:hypothetical protein
VCLDTGRAYSGPVASPIGLQLSPAFGVLQNVLVTLIVSLLQLLLCTVLDLLHFALPLCLTLTLGVQDLLQFISIPSIQAVVFLEGQPARLLVQRILSSCLLQSQGIC